MTSDRSRLNDEMGTVASSEGDTMPPASPATTTAAAAAAPFPLFRLPPELRNAVYDRALLPHSIFRLAYFNNPQSNVVVPSLPHHITPAPTLLTTPVSIQQQLQNASAPLPDRPKSSTPALSSSVTMRADTNLLLSNKTVRAEYEDRAKKAMTLVLQDNENYAFQLIKLPDEAKDVYWAELHIILFCHQCPYLGHFDNFTCQAAHEVKHHHQWITHLLGQLANLRSFTINACLCYNHPGVLGKEKLPCEAIVRRQLQVLYSSPKLDRLTLYKYDTNGKVNLDGPKLFIKEWDKNKKSRITGESTDGVETAGDDESNKMPESSDEDEEEQQEQEDEDEGGKLT